MKSRLLVFITASVKIDNGFSALDPPETPAGIGKEPSWQGHTLRPSVQHDINPSVDMGQNWRNVQGI